MKKEFVLQEFTGPLDLLLQLIEQKEVEITSIAIADVTEQFLQYLEEVEERSADELADFLVVATKLLLLKSHALLPYLHLEEEEDPGELEAQLRMYKKYVDAMKQVEERIASGQFLYPRTDSSGTIDVGFSPPPKLGADDLHATYVTILQRLEPVVKIPKAAIAKVVSLREKLQQIQELISTNIEMHFHELLADSKDKGEVVVTFMALLELVKQRAVAVQQKDAFGSMVIKKIT